MHSFLYFKRAGGSHISTMFYTCNMQKRENKAIFLRISGEMAKKQRNMQPTAKRNGSMQGFAPRKHPPPGLQPGLHCKTTFCFSASLACNTVTQNIPQQPASSPPASAGNNLSPYPSFYIGTITTFLHPTHSNSRQVSPAGCQYSSLFTSFFLIFCKYFSFF